MSSWLLFTINVSTTLPLCVGLRQISEHGLGDCLVLVFGPIGDREGLVMCVRAVGRWERSFGRPISLRTTGILQYGVT